MAMMIVMEPGDTVARLRDIRVEDGDPRELQRVVGGYVDAHPLGNDCYLYVPEDPEGRAVNHMATDLVKVAPTRQTGSAMPFAGFQQTIYGTAVLVTADPTTGQELTPNQKAYDLLAEAGVDVAVHLPNGAVLSTDVANGITDLSASKAADSGKTISGIPFVNDFLLMRRDEKIAREFDEVEIRRMINDWLDSGVTDMPGTRLGARLERLIQVIAQQAADRETANYLRGRLRKLAAEEIDKRQRGDGPVFAKHLNDKAPLDADTMHKLGSSAWDNSNPEPGYPTTPVLPQSEWERAVRDSSKGSPDSLMDVPAKIGYGKDWERSTKDTYRGDVTEMIRRMQNKGDGV